MMALFLPSGWRASAQTPGRNSGDPAASSTPDSATLAGVVVNAVTGMPVPRALVQTGGRVMLTNHDGKFEFDQFTAMRGSFIQVTKPGYYASLDANGGGGIYVSSDQLSGPIRLRLYPESLLTGTVSTDGEALAHVQVSAMRRVFDENGRRWVPVGQTETNVRGEFRIPVKAGEYRLETHYQARNASGSDVLMPSTFPDDSSSNGSGMVRLHSGEEQHFDLHPAKASAFLVSVEMEPAAGFAMLRARMAGGPWFQAASVRVQRPGLYQMELPNGAYTLSATKYGQNGGETAETTVTVAGHDVSGVVLRFLPSQAIPIEIKTEPSTSDNATAPNPEALGLMLKNIDPDADPNVVGAYLNRQSDGSIVFHVSPGSYRLKARNFGTQWFVESATYGGIDLLQQDMVVIAGAGAGPIELTLSDRPGSLTGIATVKGVPASCWIYLVSTTPSATPVTTIESNARGTFSWRLPPGRYQAVAFERRRSADWSDPAALAPFASRVRTVVIQAGDKATLDLDAVTDEETAP